MTFRAELGRREKLLTALVALGVGFALAVFFEMSAGDVGAARFYLPAAFLVAIFGIAYGFRPTAYTLGVRELAVERPFGAWTLPYSRIRGVRAPASHPRVFTIGLFRVEGFFGSYGIYWNRAWGVFRAFVTDSKKLVEIVLEDGTRVILSPSDPTSFRAALIARAQQNGVEIAIAT